MTDPAAPDSAQPCRVFIQGDLTIYTARELADTLLQPIAGCASLEVDLSEVTEVDTAGLQLLIAAKNEAAAQGKTLHCTGHSEAMLAALDLSGLVGFFGDPVLIPSESGREKEPT